MRKSGIKSDDCDDRVNEKPAPYQYFSRGQKGKDTDQIQVIKLDCEIKQG